MRTNSHLEQSRLARVLKWAAIPAGIAASAALVWGSSYAAFSATTESPDNNWSAGTVKLTDDDAGSAAFVAANLKPGATGSSCLTVTSTGSLPAAVKLFGTGAAATKDLASFLDLTIEEGTGGGFGSCAEFTATGTAYAGTLGDFGTTRASYGAGVGTWRTTGSGAETRTYKVTYTLRETTPNTAQGGTAGIAFTWESRNE